MRNIVSPLDGIRSPFGTLRWSPRALFAASEVGAWYDPSDTSTAYADSSATTVSRMRGNLKAIKDKSGNGFTASKSGSTSTLRLYRDRTASKPYVRMALGTDALTINFGASLGTNCTIVYANATSVEFREGQTVGSTYDINKHFWQLLIIDRALTDAEKTQVRNYFSAKCPNYVSSYDCYVDATNGNDANDGLTEATAKKSMTAAQTQLLALPSGGRLCVLPGTYGNFPTYSSVIGLAGKTHNIHCPKSGVVMDLGETPTVGTSSAFDISGYSGHVLNVYGDGNFTIQNVGNNGWGGSNAGIGTLYDTLITNCDDGVTAHSTTTLSVDRVTVQNCTKGAFTHTGNVSNTYHYQSVFVGRLAATVGVGLAEKGVNFTFEDCDFLPDPATTTTWTAYYLSASAANTGDGTTRVFRRCRMGAPHITPGTVPVSNLHNTTVEDCYFNGFYFQGVNVATNNTFTRCFGKWTVRPRHTATTVMNVDNCVFVGGSAAAGNRAIYADFYSSPTDVFGSGRVKNSIIKSCAAAFYAASNASVLDGSWSFLNNCLYSNTLNYTVGVSADGTDVTSDPLLSNPTTDEPDDWYVAANSPCVGAGVSGANIGIGVAS